MICKKHLREMIQGAKECIRVRQELDYNAEVAYLKDRIKHNFKGSSCTEWEGPLCIHEWSALGARRQCLESAGLPSCHGGQ